jgi:uncharacterized protein with von Willebrand factor type A (vWA) domain
MDERIVQFIRALRATGVRVSVAESADALRAVEQVGVMDREIFKAALRTALVKDARSLPIFEELFPLFFGLGEPPMMPATGGLSPRDQRLLQQALQALARLFGPQMAELLRRLLEGQPFTPEELQALARYAGSRHIREWADRQALARWMQRGAGLDERLEEMLRALLRMLAEAGMDANTLRQLEERMRANRAALVRQIQQAAGMSAPGTPGRAPPGAQRGGAPGAPVPRPDPHRSPPHAPDGRPPGRPPAHPGRPAYEARGWPPAGRQGHAAG